MGQKMSFMDRWKLHWLLALKFMGLMAAEAWIEENRKHTTCSRSRAEHVLKFHKDVFYIVDAKQLSFSFASISSIVFPLLINVMVKLHAGSHYSTCGPRLVSVSRD